MKNLNLFHSFSPKVDTSRQMGVNAVIYTRVSHSSQEENTSLESQKKYCDQFAIKKGFNVVGYFGGTYESAKTDDRTEFNKMLSFVKRSKNVSYILVYSYERFSRSGVGGAQIADDLLKQYKVITLAVSQELDPTTASGSFQQKILFLFGQMDNELRKDKTITGMRELLRKGYFPYNPPIGYTNISKGRAVDHKIIINEQGKLLRKAFEWKANEQMSNATIVTKLNQLGFKTNQKRFGYMIANPFYCGIIVGKLIPGEIIEGKHEPLVSRELFLKANNIIADIRIHPVSHKDVDINLPLKRFMKCGHCDTPMTGYLVKQKGLYYYKCRVNGCSTNKSAKVIHEQFKSLISAFEIEKDMVELISEGLKEVFQSVFSDQFENQRLLKVKETEVNQRIEAIEERFVIGEINRELYTKFLAKFTTERDDIQKEISKSSISSSNLEKCVKFVVNACRNPLKTWESSGIGERMRMQNLLFPDGIIYDREKGIVRTKRVNGAFALIPSIARIVAKIKKGELINFDKFSHLVTSLGFKPKTSTAVM